MIHATSILCLIQVLCAWYKYRVPDTSTAIVHNQLLASHSKAHKGPIPTLHLDVAMSNCPIVEAFCTTSDIILIRQPKYAQINILHSLEANFDVHCTLSITQVMFDHLLKTSIVIINCNKTVTDCRVIKNGCCVIKYCNRSAVVGCTGWCRVAHNYLVAGPCLNIGKIWEDQKQTADEQQQIWADHWLITIIW